MDEVDREKNMIQGLTCLLNKRKMEKEQYFILTQHVKQETTLCLLEMNGPHIHEASSTGK
jgi:hypothetical protein